jgi:hypothetical protein
MTTMGSLLPWLVAAATLAVSACSSGVQGTSDAAVGQSVTALQQSLGTPQRVTQPAGSAGTQLLHYSGMRSYQVKNNQVVAATRPPSDAETTLQYWRHACTGGANAALTAAPNSKDIHGHSLSQFSCASRKTTVLYDAQADRVVQVVKYGQ